MVHRATFSEISSASQYAALATKVSKILHEITQKAPIEQRAKEVLLRGADLIRSILHGSLLIEKRQANIAGTPTSRDDLRVFRRALDAVISARKAAPPAMDSEVPTSTPPTVSEVFQRYETDVRQLASSSSINTSTIAELERFFESMADIFYADVLDASVPHRLESFGNRM
jgi:hypothetical protein